MSSIGSLLITKYNLQNVTITSTLPYCRPQQSIFCVNSDATIVLSPSTTAGFLVFILIDNVGPYNYHFIFIQQCHKAQSKSQHFSTEQKQASLQLVSRYPFTLPRYTSNSRSQNIYIVQQMS